MFRYLCFAAVVVATCYADNDVVLTRSPQCKTRNGYYGIEGNCDFYIECRDYQAAEMLCPDGLHFNPTAVFPEYPCSYPSDVTCEGRGQPQPAQGNSECPHLFGFFPSPKASPQDCGKYRMCVDGKAFEMACPVALAFNPVVARCDWPDLVPSCDADAFLGFKCPPLRRDENGFIEGVINYRYEGNCYAFFSCELGHARLLTCDPGYAFSTNTNRCEEAERVKC